MFVCKGAACLILLSKRKMREKQLSGGGGVNEEWVEARGEAGGRETLGMVGGGRGW